MKSERFRAILYCARKQHTAEAGKGGVDFMSLFTKKETIILKTEQQKDAYIERLEKAHVAYNIHEDRDNIYSRDVSYIIRINAADMKKVG